MTIVSSDKALRPKTGITVAVIKDGLVLVGWRINGQNDKVLALPGGHIEYQETLEQTARRELIEEADITARNFELACVSSDFWPQFKWHYVNFTMIADYVGGTPVVREPDRFESWSWMSWTDVVSQKDRCGTPLRNSIDLGFDPFCRGRVVCR